MQRGEAPETFLLTLCGRRGENKAPPRDTQQRGDSPAACLPSLAAAAAASLGELRGEG